MFSLGPKIEFLKIRTGLNRIPYKSFIKKKKKRKNAKTDSLTFAFFSFQSSNFQFCQFSPLIFNFCQFKTLLQICYCCHYTHQNDAVLHVVFFFFFQKKKKKKTLAKSKQNKRIPIHNFERERESRFERERERD